MSMWHGGGSVLWQANSTLVMAKIKMLTKLMACLKFKRPSKMKTSYFIYYNFIGGTIDGKVHLKERV